MSIKRRRTRAEQAEDIRTRLLTAARSVFVRDGYHAASLDEIVRIAGFTKGAVYSRFASKADLFLALLEQRVELRTAEIAEARQAGARSVDAMFRQWLERVRGDEAWALLVLEFRIAAARDPALNARYIAIHERVVSVVAAQARRAAQAAGRTLALPAEQVAHVGLSLANGLLLEQAGGARLTDAVAHQVNARLFDALLAPAPSKSRRR